MRTTRSLILAGALALLVSTPVLAEAACKQRGDRPVVMIKTKTAIRRGPGLNYPVSSMIDDNRCVTMSEVSQDEAWVLIEDQEKKLFGWVPASALDSSSQRQLEGAKAKTGPIGSGQERGFVVTKASSSLLARPDPDAEVRKLLPVGSKLLALSLSEDGTWVEVRDERGEVGWVGARGLSDETGTLQNLPRTSGGLKTGMSTDAKEDVVRAAPPSDPPADAKRKTRKERVEAAKAAEAKEKSGGGTVVPVDEQTSTTVAPSETPVGVELRVLAVGALPQHGLDSNGQLGIRRYTVSAFATGGHAEAIVGPLGDVRARVGYSFVMLAGLQPANNPQIKVSGQQHDASLLIGYPIELDGFRIIPEGGYVFSLYAMQPALPGSNVPQFFSSHSHSGRVGAQAIIDLSADFALEVDAGATVGTTIEYPFDLGGAGLTIGAAGGIGARYMFSPGFGAVLRWDLLYRRAPFAGQSQLDPSITQADLTRLENGFSAGLALTL